MEVLIPANSSTLSKVNNGSAVPVLRYLPSAPAQLLDQGPSHASIALVERVEHQARFRTGSQAAEYRTGCLKSSSKRRSERRNNRMVVVMVVAEEDEEVKLAHHHSVEKRTTLHIRSEMRSPKVLGRRDILL